jgi:hypothetical protein
MWGASWGCRSTPFRPGKPSLGASMSEMVGTDSFTTGLENQKKQAKCDTCNPLIDKQLRGIREDELPKWNQQLSPSVPKIDY